jgi:hypothetical protein
MTLDLSHVTVVQFFTVLIAVAAVDIVTGIYAAVMTHTFDWSRFGDFVVQHGLPVVLLTGLVTISLSFPPDQRAPFWLASAAGLAGYAVKTFTSAIANLQLAVNPPSVTGLTVTSSGPKAQ